jgi:hypothetical protein
MKKLFAVLMIAGLFGFASCGNSNKTEENASTMDTVAPATEPSTMEAAPATATTDSTAAAPADTTQK